MKWIKVEDQLPESEGWYLTHWSDGSIESFHFADNRPADQYWHGRPLNNAVITHWSILPDPPEE